MSPNEQTGAAELTQAPSRPFAALAYMTVAALSFTLMAIAGRELADKLDTFEVMTYRSLIGLAVILAIAWASGTTGQIRARRLGLHGFRNAGHFFGQNCWLYAVGVIPFSQLFAFEFSVPLWTALIAPLVLSERLTANRIAAAGVGFLGILLVARPDVSGVSAGVVAAFFAAIGFTIASVTTKLLTRTETIISILFWLSLMQFALGLVFAGCDLDVAIPTWADWLWLLVVALTGLSAHYCITTALSIAPATVVLPLDFARLPIIAVIGMLFYDEPLAPMVFLGAAVIFFANYMNLRAEARAAAGARKTGA